LDKTWLSVEQICRRLQIHPQTVRRWLRDGELPGALIGDRAGYRVNPDDLLLFLRSRGYRPEVLDSLKRGIDEEHTE
jgi:excisionase family DNA binding protein